MLKRGDHEKGEDLDGAKGESAVNLDDKTNFFTFLNMKHGIMRKGNQAWYSYGEVSNLELMANYNFCIKDN